MRKIAHLLLAFILFFSSGLLNAQVGIGISSPNSSAQLDVSSTSKGFLPPRMTKVQRDAISSPTAGLIVWCSNCGTNGELQVYNGSNWTNLIGSAASAAAPTVTTTTVSNIAATTATSGGNITNDGGATITARGVCWSTLQNPTVSDSKTTDAGTTGSYTSSITGLTGSTTYYVRAYATNSVGTTYGAQETFTTSAPAFACGTSTVTFNAGSGNIVYGTISRDYGGGNVKCWLDRNLGATNAASSSTDNAAYGFFYQWGRSGSDGHQIVDWSTTPATLTTTTTTKSDNPGNNLFIIDASGISPQDWRSTPDNNLWQGISGVNNPCPTGWRLPTQAEWTTEVATWASENDAVDALAYLKLPLSAGRSYANGGINSANSMGVYWSSTVGASISAGKSFRLYFASTGPYQLAADSRSFGATIRCIKD